MLSMSSVFSPHLGGIAPRSGCGKSTRARPTSANRPALRAGRLRCAASGSNFDPRAGESAQEMTERRIRESEAVDRRTQNVTSLAELDAFLTEAGDKLVFLSVESTEECDLSDYPDPKDVARTVSDDTMNPCVRVKHTLARVARECDDAVFLSLEVSDDTPELVAMARELGVTRFPTFQYYKNNELVWEHSGAGQFTNQSIGEGMLFYGDQAAGGVHASEFISKISSQSELDDFLDMCAVPQTSALGVELDVPCDKQLAVLNVSMNKGSQGCMHVYPAVLALAKNTAGACRWGRLIGDSSDSAADFMKSLNVDRVPAFIFYESHREVGRYYGSDRLELMNKVIEIQQAEGIRLPDRQARKRIPTSEAKRIAKEARERNRASQW
eukprot:CAMPEP_0117667202 /NCGR_PEP_ID=MMETSP0804-20121206/10826_1 /TAXON_ID=1074897 /ORGANISM="Tetraselmis astigmatica, Strain CCMP880" /LENGTH=382 /DNA_ID=CAMNT_0005474883 /DNA_START=132 /DNA_END=1277 /DNA_ORIENTATION=+